MAEASREHQDINMFDGGLKQKETLHILGGEVQFMEAVPENCKHEVPYVVVSGWGATPEVYSDTLKVIAQKGYNVFAMSNSSSEKTEQDQELRELPEAEVRGALALLEFLHERDFKKVDLICHSEGAIKAAIAASIEPDLIRKMVLFNPSGMIGRDSLPKLFGRFTMNTIRDKIKTLFDKEPIKSRMHRSDRAGMKNIKKNWKELLGASVAVTRSDITGMVGDLRKSGTKVYVVAAVGDTLIPMDKVQNALGKKQVDGFFSTSGGHRNIFAEPEKYVAPVIEALEDNK